MKAGVFAVAAAIATGVSARQDHLHARRHAHEALHLERNVLAAGTGSPETCGCTTIYTTIYGAPTLLGMSAGPVVSATSATSAPSSAAFSVATYEGVVSSSASSPTAFSSTPSPSVPASSSSIVSSAPVVPTSTASPEYPVPTALASTVATPGVYTIPASTIIISETTTVAGPATTNLPAGTNTYGGVVTVVETATTVVCPFATVKTNSGVVTSTIESTTYVCPSAGTYTIAPSTTVVPTSTFIVYPTPVTYTPGTYIRPATVTTVTLTDYVIYCPFAAAETSAASVPVVASSVAPVVVASSVAPVVASSSSAIPVTSSSSSSSGSLGVSGDQWAMTYSPYTSSGSCMDAGSVASDIANIAKAGFKSVRLYSTDCSGLTNVGNACKANGLQLILGIFISNTGISDAQEQVTDIITWGDFSIVELIVIGNEAVFNGYCSASDLASFITSSKAKFSAAGYTGPCTTTEPLNIWQSNIGALCGSVDVVGCNIHPFFNADVQASDAGTFVVSQLAIVDSLCPGKTGINLETGWPSAGTCNGQACPGASEQATAVKAITDAVGGKSVMFSYENDLWKPVGEFDCEQSWGAIHLFS